jgi:tRNA(Ile)-lysidine synthase
LRALLKRRNARWIEDPMNADPRFARARLRALMPALEAAGVPALRIGHAAHHLARVREALDDETAKFLRAHARFESDGCALLGSLALRAQPREIALRALSAVLMRVSGETYRPRFERLERLLDSVTQPNFTKARTLHSCRIARAPKAQNLFGPLTLVIAREAVRRSTDKSKKNQQRAIKSTHVASQKSTDVASDLAARHGYQFVDHK